MRKRKPAEVFPPGAYIKEELDIQGWTGADLARALGYSIDGVLAGEQTITPKIAKDLGRVFGIDPQFWLSLEKR